MPLTAPIDRMPWANRATPAHSATQPPTYINQIPSSFDQPIRNGVHGWPSRSASMPAQALKILGCTTAIDATGNASSIA